MHPRLHLISVILMAAVSMTACGDLQAGLESTPTPAGSGRATELAAELQTQIVGTATALRAVTSAPSATVALGTQPPLPTGTPLAEAATASPIPPKTTQPPVVASPIPASAQTQIPAPVATPFIGSFTASKVADVVPGESLVLQWTTRDAITVTITHVLPTGYLGELYRTDLPANGSVTLPTATGMRYSHGFMLVAYGPGGESAPVTLDVHFRCAHEFFFSPPPADLCPDGPADTRAIVQQDFEGGRMLWIPHSATQRLVYVLFNNGEAQGHRDMWTEGQSEWILPLTPPPGRFQPVRGFGAIWQMYPTWREQLGWALAPEQQFSTSYQQETAGKDLKGWNYFVRLTDGTVVRLLGHYATYAWQAVSP